MHSSKSVIKGIEVESVVVDFIPKAFPVLLPSEAKRYAGGQEKSDFELNPLISEQIGISSIIRQSMEKKIEERALELLKDVQEHAYAEARTLGLEEGKTEAFATYKLEFERHFDDLNKLLVSLREIKRELVESNEGNIIKLVYYFAKRLALKTIETEPESILRVIKDIVAETENIETVTVKIAPPDHDFITKSLTQFEKEYEFIKKVKFEVLDSLTPGGCVIETNYGTVDATLEQRLGRLWETLNQRLPKAKDQYASE